MLTIPLARPLVVRLLQDLVSPATGGGTPPGPAAPIRYNFSWRQTAAGSNTWDGGGLNLGGDVDPQSATEVTSLLLAGADGYPLDSANNELLYGRASGTPPSGTNVSKTQAGGNPLLGGFHTGTPRPAYTFEVPGPGVYDVWFAAGTHTTVSTEEIMLFDGLYSDLVAILTTRPRIWKAATSVAANQFIVSLADYSVWKADVAGTSGSIEPSGAGPTFADNGITWTRQPLDAIYVFRGTTAAIGQVIDQNSTSVTAAAWASSLPRAFTVTGDHGSGLTLYIETGRPRQFSFQKQVGALEDVSLRDIWLDDPGTNPEILAGQPDNAMALRITPKSGGNAVSNYSLTGSLSGYFKLQAAAGYVWLVHNSTRIPDSMAGPQTVNVVQTDPASGPAHTTSFTPTVISSQGRNTGSSYLGRIRTETYLARTQIMGVTDAVWSGYAGEVFASDTLVSDGASLDAALAALSPSGSDWHRIRLGNGTYEGGTTMAVHKDFGAGGLLIEPDSGATPNWNRAYANWMIHGVHIRNLQIGLDVSKMGVLLFFLRFNDPGPGGIGGGGRFNRVAVTGCSLGINFVGLDTATDLAKHAHFLWMLHGESLYADGNTLDGVRVPWAINGVWKQSYSNNSYSRGSADLFAIGNAEDWTSTVGVFPTDDQFIRLYREVVPREVDFPGYSSGVHLDFIQIRTFARNLTSWWPNAKPDNQPVSDDAYPYWAVGDKCYCYETTAIYEVTAVSKPEALTGSTPPSGAGAGIVDGDVTWAFVANYVHTGALHLLVEDCTQNSASPVAGVAARQFFINSNGRHNAPANITVINTVAASSSSYGVGQADGDAYVDCSTFVGPSDYKIGSPVNPSYTQIAERGRLLAVNNVNQLPTTSSGDGIKRFVQNEVMVNFAGTSASPSRPEDRLAGTFSRKDGAGRWTFPSVPLDGSLSREAFIEAVRSQVRAKAGVSAGID